MNIKCSTVTPVKFSEGQDLLLRGTVPSMKDSTASAGNFQVSSLRRLLLSSNTKESLDSNPVAAFLSCKNGIYDIAVYVKI